MLTNKDLYIYSCGNMRKDSGHVVCCFGQSASFPIFDSAFYFLQCSILPTAVTVSAYYVRGGDGIEIHKIHCLGIFFTEHVLTFV